MTGLTVTSTWWSRLADTTLADDLGFTPNADHEIPHVRGLPIQIPLPEGHRAVREWPNRAGRLEPVLDGDIVRWDRGLAPPPPGDHVIGRGEPIDVATLVTMRQWFNRFIGSLEQIRHITRAAPCETPRAILLTPGNPTGETPLGVEPLPKRLAEFPGGIQITLYADAWHERDAYADKVRGWLLDHARDTAIGRRH